jgi:hypothetical protein
MPANNSLWFYNVKGLTPARPRSGEQYPKQAICISQSWPRIAVLQDCKLLPKNEIFNCQITLST